MITDDILRRDLITEKLGSPPIHLVGVINRIRVDHDAPDYWNDEEFAKLQSITKTYEHVS